ncbi:MAG: hypothetical protein WBG01_10070 [Bacteroidota bacterium]
MKMYAVLVTLSLAGAVCLAGASDDGAGRSRGNQLAKPSGLPGLTHFNINRMATPVDAYGRMDISERSVGRYGLIYPRGSGKSCVFMSGLMWGGRFGIGGDIRVRGSGYDPGLQPGKILADGMYDNPGLQHNRIYRVRRDIPPGSRSADITAEQLDGEGSPDQIFNQYYKDWNEWPWEDGAPYDDKDKDGRYDPNADVPGVKGADQTIWFVANDLSQRAPEQGLSFLPLSTEVQVTVWGYARQDGLAYTSFRRYLLINKSGVVIDSMYVTQWVDPDLGNSDNDFVGCDTVRSLGFAYNGYATDNFYDPLPPPAVGFDFLQGPVVPAGPSDSAIFRGEWIKGWRNLPMTSFGAFNRFSADPSYEDPETAWQSYNLMKGLTRDGLPWINRETGDTTNFPFPGDPETQTGWLDRSAGDRRFVLNSGPFTMQPGDTQEVVVAVVVAGAEEGIEYLPAVSLMKAFDEEAQNAYNEFFAMPEPPPAPLVTATALDGEVLLSWHENGQAVEATETANYKDFTFQGYNVYQFPSGSSSLQEGKRLATFDIVDGVAMIKERVRDPVTGDSMNVARQYGTDSGIQRYFQVSRDPFNINLPMVNGTKYYFAVTAYNYNPTPPTTLHALESSPRIVTVIPASTSPGERFGAAYGDTVPTVHSLGPTNGYPVVRITNPTLVEGKEYEIRTIVQDSVTLDFEGTPMKFPYPQWELWNPSSNQIVLPACTVFTSTTADQIADNCIQVGFAAQRVWVPGEEISAIEYTPTAHLNWVGVDAGLSTFDGGLDVAWRLPDPGYSTLRPFEVFKPVEIRFDSSSGQNAYVFERTFFATAGARYTGFKPQPFQVYDVSNPSDPRQVDFVFMEQIGSSALDGVWAPALPPASLGRGEYFWIVDEEYTDSEKSEYVGSTLNALLSSKPGLYGGAFVREDSARPAYLDGDVFSISGNAYVTAEDKWTFSTKGLEITYSPTLAQDDVSQINVFPNPYYGVNPQELDRYGRFVTFNHLPERAIIRIFNLGGIMVRRINKEGQSQFEQWDLKNQDGLPVGSGLYIAHIEMPDLGVSKVLKLAIVQEQQILDRY